VPAIVARALPAVVSITTRQIERDQFNQPVPTRGLGSGFIVDHRGYILTNNHVVEGAELIKVTLPDERAFRATLVGADRFTDLAVLKIEARDLSVLPLGDSSRLAVGETVIAIGSPLWIEGGPTVTVGVVSALGRSMEEPGLPILHDLIQTDAAINPGNSGGPLLSTAGRVVGINTAAIHSAHGIGFAISTNSAKPVLRALLETGRVSRRTLGITAVSVTPQVAYVNDLPIERGALVVRVEAGGPGEAAGFKPGDVITSVAGEGVRDLHHFHESLSRRKAGDVVEVVLWREGQTLALRPVLGEEQ
jgi:S1-C subfamily serine protease